MERVELGRQPVPAGQLNTRTVVERAGMPGHQLIRTDNPPVEGRLVFRSLIKKEGGWELQEGNVLLDPEKPMVIIGKL